MSNVEISAQEAVYIVLQLPMRKASRQVILINTSPPEERVELLKPLDDIKDMEDDCEDIYTNGLIKRYTMRTSSLENITLADWAAWYDMCGKPYVKQSNELDVDNLLSETCNDDDYNDDDDDDGDDDKSSKKVILAKTKKRTKARIIRSCWFSKEAEPEKYYRELIMLFTSWRNEETDLIGAFSSYQQRYMLLFNAVEKQMKQYAICNEDFNDIQQEMNTLDKSYMYDTIAPCSQNIEDHDETEGDTDLHPDFNENYNLSDDIGIPSVDSNTEPLILNEMQDDEYRRMVQMLNREQKEFFYHVLHLTKTSDEPFYCFLSGGAGVGELHLTKPSIRLH